MASRKYTIRPAVPEQDYAALARLLCQIWHEPTTAQNLHDWDSLGRDEDGRVLRRNLLQDERGRLIGYGIVRHMAHEAEGWFYVWVGIAPGHRRQGWGQLLYQNTLDTALAHGATELGTDVLDDCPECLRFAEKQGFIVDRHLYESVIDLRPFDPASFAGLVEAVAATGIRFTSLAAEGDTEEARRKLHRLNYACALDDPASHGTFPDFDQLNATWNQVSWFIPEGQLLAVDGERYVGLAAVGTFPETNAMYNLMTAVDREYRGRKIAQALKLLSIQFAQAYGADTIRTHNDSQNKPMLAINRKLGYRPRVGEYRLRQKVTGA